jgi:redox-sensitive bicupin YhaK (pirin superfamily)
MILIRKSDDRGHVDHGWLETWHTFSFADFYDPEHMGFGALRVLNQDRVQPGRGFGAHPHRDMEIVTWVLEGELQHRDSIGNGSIIRPGDAQFMSAGEGIVHSEFNPSSDDLVELLQMWLIPAQRGGKPRYEQRHFDPATLQGRLVPIVAGDGRDGALRIGQDVTLYAGKIGAGDHAEIDLAPSRLAWVHCARGSVALDDHRLGSGDGAGIVEESKIVLDGREDADVVVFDLPPE